MKTDNVTIFIYGTQEKLKIHKCYYGNQRTAYTFTCYDSGEPFCKLTTNLPDEENVQENQFFIKNSEPEVLIAEQLEKEGLIKRTTRQAGSGFCDTYATLWEEL